MKTPSNTIKPVMLGLGLLALAACQHTDVGVPTTAEPVHRNMVQMVRLPHAIAAEEDGTDTPSSGTLAALDAFLASVNAGYGDLVLLDTTDASPNRIRALEAHVRARGLVFAGVSSLGAAPAPGAITLYIERQIVTTPECGNWPREVSNNQRNNTSSYFGCATSATLGLMIANPRDLTSGQAGGNSTGAAVGALYSPKAGSGAPSVTMSFDGLGEMAAPATDSGSK